VGDFAQPVVSGKASVMSRSFRNESMAAFSGASSISGRMQASGSVASTYSQKRAAPLMASQDYTKQRK